MNVHFSMVFLVLVLFISACAPVIKHSPESSRKYQYKTDGIGKDTGIDPYKVKPAIPKVEPKSKYGNPPSYTVFGQRYYVLNSAKGYKQRGDASWYGKKFHGERTSSGETYDMYAMTAAHKTLPLPSYVKVTNLENQRSVIVKLNDRGPFHAGRIIDLSYSAARQLGIIAKGTGPVKVEAIDPILWAENNSQQLAQGSTETQGHPKIAQGYPKTVEGSQQAVKDFPQVVKDFPQVVKDFPKVVKDFPQAVKDLQKIAAVFPKSYIQVGAFREIKNAYALAEKLRTLFNYPVLISKKKANNQWLSTVKIGPFSSQLLENSILNKIIAQGYSMARIVK